MFYKQTKIPKQTFYTESKKVQKKLRIGFLLMFYQETKFLKNALQLIQKTFEKKSEWSCLISFQNRTLQKQTRKNSYKSQNNSLHIECEIIDGIVLDI